MAQEGVVTSRELVLNKNKLVAVFYVLRTVPGIVFDT